MRWLIPIGLVLILAGVAGAITAYVQSAETASTEGTAPADADGGVPATRANRTDTVSLVLAPLAGLALALGVGMVGVGMGRWTNPVRSYERPANPWNEQPAEKGGPPVGLV